MSNHSTCEPKISFFQAPITNIVPNTALTIHQVFDLIKGDSYSCVTETLRKLDSSVEAKAFKAKNFDFVTFSGTFKTRTAKNLIDHSGFLTLDIDDVEVPQKVKQTLIEDPFLDPLLVFTSPSGKGIKCIVEIEHQEFSNSEYLIALENYLEITYNIKVDPSGKDVSRSCFLAHDPEAFINQKY